jgi:hypothetical protein
MIVRALDENGDWTFGSGIQNYLTLNAAIAQCIRTRFLSFLGDCFFATSDGIDWFNLLGPNNQLSINLSINASILNLTGMVNGQTVNLVTGILQLSFKLDAEREFDVKYQVSTIYSSTQILTGSFQATVPPSQTGGN